MLGACMCNLCGLKVLGFKQRILNFDIFKFTWLYDIFLQSLLTNMQNELLDNLIKTVTILLNMKTCKREITLTQVEP